MRTRINPPLPSEPVTGSRTLRALKNFRPARQSKDYTCGPACARSVLHFLKAGMNIPEKHLAHECRTTSRDGTTPDGLVYGLQFYGVPAKVATLSRQQIINQLKNDKPVFLLWGDWSKGGHWVVAIGYDSKKRTLLMADPEAPKGLRCHKWSTLDRYWRATIGSKTYTRTGVLV